MIVSLYEGKVERAECISLSSVVRKIYAEILVYIVRRVTGGLVDDEQGGFRAGDGV